MLDTVKLTVSSENKFNFFVCDDGHLSTVLLLSGPVEHSRDGFSSLIQQILYLLDNSMDSFARRSFSPSTSQFSNLLRRLDLSISPESAIDLLYPTNFILAILISTNICFYPQIMSINLNETLDMTYVT